MYESVLYENSRLTCHRRKYSVSVSLSASGFRRIISWRKKKITSPKWW